jgi:O-antigen/teichoic acid export membrane protein
MESIKKNYTYNIILTLTNILFPIVTFPYISRIIGPFGIGKVQFVISLTQYFALFAGLGIPIYGIREIAKHKGDQNKLSQAFSELIIIYLVTSIVVSIIYLLIILNFKYFTADRNLYLLSLSLILFGFSSIDWLYAGLEEFKLIAVRSVLIKVISVVAVFVYINNATDYYYYMYISIFSVLGNNIINLLLVRKKVDVSIRSLNFKKHFRPLFYIFGTTLATSMYTVLDTVLLGFLSNAKAVGFYTAAVRLTKISLPFITSMGAVTLPSLSKSFHDGNEMALKRTLQKSFDFIVFFSIPISIGSFLLSEEFVIVFSGKDFVAAIQPMQIMSIIPLLVGLGFFFGFQVLVPASKDRELFISVMVGMVLGIVINFLLVPKFNATGEALANVFTELIVTLCYFIFVKKNDLFAPQLTSLFQAILASLIFIPICYWVNLLLLSILFKLIVAVISCAILYALLQSLIFKNQMALELINTVKQKLNR